MKRFKVKRFKLVHRNSMIRGNPVDKRFEVYGIADVKWESSRHASCSFYGYEKNNGMKHDPQLRAIFRDGMLAKDVCSKMNELDKQYGHPRDIGFKCIDGHYDPCLTSVDDVVVTSFDN